MAGLKTGETALKNNSAPEIPGKSFKHFVSAVFLILILISASCSKNEPVPVARFTFNASQDYKIPCTVNFINQSAQAYSYAWWFGTDSSITSINEPGSIAQNPSYIYNRPGTFIVTLRAFTETHKEWATMVQTITIRDTLIQSTNK